MDREIEVAEALRTRLRIGRGDGEVTAETDDRLGLTVAHRGDALDHRMAVIAGRLEPEHVAHVVEQQGHRPLGDADGAVALDVAVATQGTDPRTWPTHVTTQEKQVRDLLDVARAGPVLGDAHAVAADRRVRFRIRERDLFQITAREPAGTLDIRPFGDREIGDIVVEPGGMLGDERVIERALAAGDLGRLVECDQRLGDALERSRVAADLHLVIAAGDRGCRHRRHLDHRLRRFEAFERAFLERVEDDDLAAALRHLAQCRHHPRMVGAGVVADRQDQVGAVEILEADGALADADRLWQPDRSRLVAHVRAVREVVGAVKPHEQLEQECRFVRAATRGVEFGLVRIGHGGEAGADLAHSLVPAHDLVMVGGGVVAKRLGDAALILDPVIALLPDVGDAVLGKELGTDRLGGGFPCDGLRAVLAEFERRGVLRVGPCAARAIEAVGLVRLQQRLATAHDDLLRLQRYRDRLQRTPATSRSGIVGDPIGTFVTHTRLSRRSLLDDRIRMSRRLTDRPSLRSLRGDR